MPEPLSVATTQEIHLGNFSASVFNTLALREGLLHVHRAHFPATDLTLAKLTVFGEVEAAEQYAGAAHVVLRPEPRMLIHLTAERGNGDIVVAGVDREAVGKVASEIVESLRDAESDDEVPIVFWANAPGHPMSPRRRISAPAWAEIESNYSQEVRDALGPLMGATCTGPGSLLLWHGEPGTGKSYALRALARAWHGWCDVHVITDADAFLGGEASYLLSTLLLEQREGRWRLIVLEDAGELLTADARAVAGQGLSRLLNMSDGLLGAGLRTIVLVTTNEPIGRLHPAVVRPGRTWEQVEFSALSVPEASAWLAARNPDARANRPLTVAELFALAEGRAPAARAGAVGFAA
jgi:hypothetical protein